MAKKVKKGDAEKKAALHSKKQAKQDKAATKRLAKEAAAAPRSSFGGKHDAAANGPDQKQQQQQQQQQQQHHFESLLEQYRKQDELALGAEHHVMEKIENFPKPRANATLTLALDNHNGKKKKKKNAAELYLFGGEYYDGVETIGLDHLLKYDSETWWRIWTAPPRPPARCSHSTVYYNGCLYVLAGELSAGGSNDYFHYKDLWKYDIRQRQWTELKSSSSAGTTPSARSGHAAAVWKHFMIVFGGFYEAAAGRGASSGVPKWYNDVTVFDLQTEQWMEVPHSKLAMSNRPEPRSACNMAVVQDDKIIVQGGFSKLALDKSNKQQQQQPAQIDGNTTCFVVQSETKVHTDSWMLHLKPLLSNKPPIWERLTSSMPRNQLPGFGTNIATNSTTFRHPCGRSGTASVGYKDRLLVFGGVVDTEQLHHRVDSVFYNDMFTLDVDKRKWFPIHMNSAKKQSSALEGRVDGKEENGMNDHHHRKVDTADEDEDTSDLEIGGGEDDDDSIDDERVKEHEGWDLGKLRSTIFAFVDGSGNLVYEKIDKNDEQGGAQIIAASSSSSDDEQEEEKQSDEVRKAKEFDPSTPTLKQEPISMFRDPRTIPSSSVMTLNPKTQLPEAATSSEPLPRIKASLVVSGHTLYLFGGLVEVGDRELTLDDMWSFDLRRRGTWQCIWPGTMHQQVWRGAMHDDDGSYFSSTGQSLGDGEEDDDDDDSDDSGEWSEKEGIKEGEESAKEKSKNAKKKKRSVLRQELAKLTDRYDLNEMQTPGLNEGLSDFYARTGSYWNQEASARNESWSGKELKRQGFALAQERYLELTPIMSRWREM
jgi:hypothetical protein